MVLYLGETGGSSLSRQSQVLVFPPWRITGQAIEFCVAHEAGGGEMGHNAALQTQVYL